MALGSEDKKNGWFGDPKYLLSPLNPYRAAMGS